MVCHAWDAAKDVSHEHNWKAATADVEHTYNIFKTVIGWLSKKEKKEWF